MMKTFVKYVTIIIFLITFLGAGFYLMLNNLGSLLSADHTGLQCKWISSGVEIQTGGRVERIQLEIPVHFRYNAGKWEIQNGKNTVIIDKIPWFKLRLKKVLAPSPETNIKKATF